MRFVEEAVLGLVANVDNLLVGCAFGLGGARVSHTNNGIIALCNCAATFLSMSTGRLFLQFISPLAADLIAAAVFVALGCASLCHTSHDAPQTKAAMSAREAFVVGVSLSFSNVASGLAAGLAGFSVVSQVVVMIFCSFFGLELGQRLGSTLGTRLTPRSSAQLGAIAFVSLGVWRVANFVTSAQAASALDA
jgi:putative Mn2+ efflux pump MntP